MSLRKEQIIVSITRSALFLGNNPVQRSRLLAEVQKSLEKTKAKNVFIRGDYGLKYGVIAQAMSDLKSGGISNISLVTEIEKKR